MTREEMILIKWKPYMIIDYQDHGMQMPAACLLSGIDFDSETLILTPINEFYEQNEFIANLRFCSLPKRMKITTLNGKQVGDATENFIKARKYPKQ